MSIVFIVSAPSGSGKSTLVGRLLKQAPGLLFSISYTTRTPRGRVATPLAWTHLGMVAPPRASGLGQTGLFE